MKCEQVVQYCGAKVRVCGENEFLREPRINQCPLHESLYGSKGIDKKSVKRQLRLKCTHKASAANTESSMIQ